VTDQPTPSWKFWHPLPFWHVIVVLLVLNVGLQLLGVGLREGLGVTFFSGPLASGLAGGLGVWIILLLAEKRRASGADPAPDGEPQEPMTD
jgi:hypothetical protein